MRSAKNFLVHFSTSIMILSAFSPSSVAFASPLRPTFTAADPIIAEEDFALPEAKVGATYEYQFQAEGGLAPFSWKIIQGELPPGVKLEATGKLSGAPTDARSEAYRFVIEVSDSSQPPQKFAQPFLLVLRAAQLRIALPQPNLKISAPKQNNTPSPVASIAEDAPSIEANGHNMPLAFNAPTSDRGGATTSPQPLAAPLVRQARPGDEFLKVTATKDATLKVIVDGLQVKLFHKGKKVDTISVSTNDEIVVTLTRPLRDGEEVVIEQSLGGQVALSKPMTVQPLQSQLRRTGELATAIVGFEQAGASAASSSRQFFFNFFISRPLPFPFKGNGYDGREFNSAFGPRLRWWSNVRVASVPQQVNQPVAQFVTNFPQEIGALKVNELAQAAEYMSGLEYRINGKDKFFLGQSEESHQQFSLSLFFGAGAIGPMEPKDTLKIFETPPANSATAEQFFKTYPQARGRQYIGFASPDRDRFYRQYSAGLRLTTFYADGNRGAPQRLTSPPAMVSVSLGQNELVSGGTMRGVVARLEAFYPLPIRGDRQALYSSIYLFLSVQKRLSKPQISDPLILNPVTLATTSPCPTTPPMDSITPCTTLNNFIANGVTVTAPSNRDIYKLGVGMDLIRLFRMRSDKVD